MDNPMASLEVLVNMEKYMKVFGKGVTETAGAD